MEFLLFTRLRKQFRWTNSKEIIIKHLIHWSRVFPFWALFFLPLSLEFRCIFILCFFVSFRSKPRFNMCLCISCGWFILRYFKSITLAIQQTCHRLFRHFFCTGTPNCNRKQAITKETIFFAFDSMPFTDLRSHSFIQKEFHLNEQDSWGCILLPMRLKG